MSTIQVWIDMKYAVTASCEWYARDKYNAAARKKGIIRRRESWVIRGRRVEDDDRPRESVVAARRLSRCQDLPVADLEKYFRNFAGDPVAKWSMTDRSSGRTEQPESDAVGRLADQLGGEIRHRRSPGGRGALAIRRAGAGRLFVADYELRWMETVSHRHDRASVFLLAGGIAGDRRPVERRRHRRRAVGEMTAVQKPEARRHGSVALRRRDDSSAEPGG